MKWKVPPKIKIYEALGCISDGRIKNKKNEASVYSSSLDKYYTVKYDEKNNAIMSNDNGSYWKGYLGYPAIAFLMKIKKLSFSKKYSDLLSGIPWKKINTKNRNNFEKTIDEIDKKLRNAKVDFEKFNEYINKVEKEIKNLKLDYSGRKIFPPK